MSSTAGGGGWLSSSSAEATAMEERRLKRRLLNRESARRTRARKEQQVKELEAEAEALRGKRSGLEEAVRAVAWGCAAVEAENAVLRARALELHSLAQLLLLRCICIDDTSSSSSSISSGTIPMQPITASAADMYAAYYDYY